MSQILEGSYYEASKDGYVNRGVQKIKFTAKVNHLPVFSRCNQLLKSEYHQLHFGPSTKLQQVHCYQSSRLISQNQKKSKNELSRFDSNVSLIHKSAQPKIFKQSQNKKLLIQQHKEKAHKKYSLQSIENPQNSHREPQTTQMDKNRYLAKYSPKSEGRNPILTSKSQCHFIKANPQSQKDQKNIKQNIKLSNNVENLTKITGQYAKNPLKQTFSPVSANTQEQNNLNADNNLLIKNRTMAKLVKNKQQVTAQNYEKYDQDECITEHAIYEPLKDKYRYHGYERRTGQQQIIDQLAYLLQKVGKLQQKIKISEQQFKIKTLQNQIIKANQKLNELKQQNLKLKARNTSNPQRVANHHTNQCGSRHLCCSSPNASFIYFVIFMAGLLFAKLALC